MSHVTLRLVHEDTHKEQYRHSIFSLEFLLNSDLGMHCIFYAFYFSQNTFTPISLLWRLVGYIICDFYPISYKRKETEWDCPQSQSFH